MPEPFTVSFEGKALPARRGQSLASVLSDGGESVFRRTAKGTGRGLFCGMGVCQDCLLTVDGRANQRACMTTAQPGMVVYRQQPAPGLGPGTPTGPGPAASLDPESAAATPAAQVLEPDVLVLGAGAGGLSAAIAAARAGVEVLVLDERKVEGGQYFKQPSADLPLLDRQQRSGAELLEKARASGARLLSGIELWGAFEGPELYASSADGEALILRPLQLIVATGAYERPRLVPGWTLPGVMTTGAAQTLWRSYRSLPGRRVAVCGSGPLNLQVALELRRGGAEEVFVAERAGSPMLNPLRSLALVASAPELAMSGIAIRLGLARAGVPVRYATELRSVEPLGSGGLRAFFRRGNREESRELDALCMNDGFEPQNEVLRLLGAKMRYDPDFGHLRCERDRHCETSVPGVFAVGDCCGLGGAPAAVAEGAIAGAAAAGRCTRGGRPESDVASETDELRQARRDLAAARRFQKHLWALHDPSPQDLVDANPETVLCRCEEITVGDFRAALSAGHSHIGAIKSATRLGMGCCQGRYCGPAAARLHARRHGGRVEDYSFFAPQVPIKPVSVDVLEATARAVEPDD
ncbi:MAG: FAD-dependent oxidoreductase [Pseudomonadota bacterium]